MTHNVHTETKCHEATQNSNSNLAIQLKEIKSKGTISKRDNQRLRRSLVGQSIRLGTRIL